jgi:hypothetical protein
LARREDSDQHSETSTTSPYFEKLYLDTKNDEKEHV